MEKTTEQIHNTLLENSQINSNHISKKKLLTGVLATVACTTMIYMVL